MKLTKMRTIGAAVATAVVGVATYSLIGTGQTVNLTWDMDAEPSVTGQYLYISKFPQSSTTGKFTTSVRRLLAPDDRAYAVNNLKNGATLYFAVTSHNDTGVESPYSNVVQVLVVAPTPTPPPEPTPTSPQDPGGTTSPASDPT